MTRTLRGAWARRGTLLPLAALTAVVVAGVSAVDAFARSAGTSPAAAVPLLLLGVVAVPATARALAQVRRGEIGLARLRGLTSAPLYAVLALEPLLALLVGAAVGVAAGAGVAAVAGRLWVGVGSTGLGVGVVTWVVVVVAAALVAVLVGTATAMREPLTDQVRATGRPRPATVAAVFGQVLVLAAAAVAVYRAGAAGAGDPDWVVLAGPALVGLAVGQLAVWAVRGLAVAWVGWSTRRGLAGYLASRRLARVADAAGALRLLVAAAVVCAVSVTGAQQVDDWADDTARLRAAAPVQVPVDADVLEAMAITAELDPDGEHLMAAALVPGEGSVVARRAFLDTARFDAVLGDFYAGTPAAGVSSLVDDLAAPDGSTVATGDEVTVTVAGVSRREPSPLHPVVSVVYLDRTGTEATVTVRLTLGPDGAPSTGSAPVPGCADGCRVARLVLGREDGDDEVPYLLTALDFAGVDALATTWAGVGQGSYGAPGGPIEVDDGLLAVGDQRRQEAVPADTGPSTPVLATTSATWPEGRPLLDDPGGEERPAGLVARLPALPLVEADGLLADLPLAAAGAQPTVPLAEVMVLAAADTPPDLLASLTAATGTEASSLADVRGDVAEEAGAVRARTYALVAGFCLLLALLVAASTVARQRAEHRREVAVLRLLRVPLRSVRGSARLELLVLGAVAVAAAAGGGLLAVRLLLGTLALVAVPEHAPPLGTGVALLPLVVAALVAAGLLAYVAGRGRRVAAADRPALLREEALP